MPRRRYLAGACLYTLLLLYGSLFPFSNWHSHADHFAFLSAWPSARPSLPDLLINVLAYLPLGVLLRTGLRGTGIAGLLLSTLVGGALSLCVEATQTHLPQRVPAISDVVMNTLGTFAGALMAHWIRPGSLAARLWTRFRSQRFQPGPLNTLALAAVGLWVLSQTAPLVPSFDLGNIRDGLKPLARTLAAPETLNAAKCLATLLAIAGLAVLTKTVALPRQRLAGPFFVFVLAVLLAKIPIVTRQISLEALLAVCAGVPLGFSLARLWRAGRPVLALALILMALVLTETTPGTGAAHRFNWTPFAAHLENSLTGAVAILEMIWPYFALAVASRLAWPEAGLTRRLATVAACAALSFALEWFQQTLPGRSPDITAVLIATCSAAFVLLQRHQADTAPPNVSPARVPPRFAPVPGALVLALGGVGSVLLALWTSSSVPRETGLDQSTQAKLPAPETLTPVHLPGFRTAHPRLPVPSAADIATLKARNPDFLSMHLNRARKGEGDLGSAILAARLMPGSQDANLIARRALQLNPTYRGNDETKPIALAYDWLYDQIDPALREKLRDKAIEACHYQIKVIREERMSPYNVFLYNSPLQALMACAIAVYADSPAAEPVMAFTADYWKNRVLPAWRQVGGHHGGWHEGGEYVGVGIGQALYQLPNMWRTATGEDYLRSEPAIRGFLDFLVYRQRPDNTAFRWGDIAFTQRQVSDALALAIEFQHKAAYSLWPGRPHEPTSWPWGPLSDPDMIDTQAARSLPTTRLFDGIGMLVARSDWSPEATYLTFKAGDNFWSHSHLDQGAFTLYKGAELALDSGCYCNYGSDHHLNYAYQSIAHNLITVTDPADTVPMPPRKDKPPRPIANDGGQRRVGSGWGIDAAPLDRDEWERKRSTFHTGRIATVFEQDGLTVAVADITPAYTNERSGDGRFADRTRRVERMWRVFAYDRPSDTVLIYDDVRASRPEFVKRWLLHSQTRPTLGAAGFVVERHPGPQPARLHATVLFPQAALLNTIGGPGFEYFVDERNYDEGGAVQRDMAKQKPNGLEAGAWRVELSPPQAREADQFLVALQPTLGERRPVQVERLSEAERLGARIVDGTRVVTLWFEPGRFGCTLDIQDARGTRHHRIEPAAEAHDAPSWLERVRHLLPGA